MNFLKHALTLLRQSNWVVIGVLVGLLWLLLVRLYYHCKPLFPVRLRVWLRRALARRKRRWHADTWPILESAGAMPEGWQGWPDSGRFALVLTHDVESPLGLGRVQRLAELEIAHGFRSAFNFIPEGPYRVPDHLRQWLIERGFEVGVHDHKHDGKLFHSRSRFRASARRINHFLEAWQAVGFRSAFMLRNLQWIHELDVLYDCSTFDTDPFEPQPDGAGTIFPFWMARRDGTGYVEMPYTLPQDSTLFLVLQEPSIEIWQRKVRWIASRGGMAMLNVHPDYMSFEPSCDTWTEFPVAHYEDFLVWLKRSYEGQYWHALPKEVALSYRDARVPDLVGRAAKPQAVPARRHEAAPVLEPQRPSTIL